MGVSTPKFDSLVGPSHSFGFIKIIGIAFLPIGSYQSSLHAFAISLYSVLIYYVKFSN